MERAFEVLRGDAVLLRFTVVNRPKQKVMDQPGQPLLNPIGKLQGKATHIMRRS